MVDLLEHEGKKLFKKYGIPIPSGYLINSTDDLKEINKESIIKAQVPAGHRGLNGGVKKIKNKNEAILVVNRIKKLSFNGFNAKSFLVEEAIKHKKELYLGLTLDRSLKMPVLIVSPYGGVEIEKIPAKNLGKFHLDIFLGMSEHVKRDAFSFVKIDEALRDKFYSILDSLWDIFTGEDAELVEINPLAVTDINLIALDSKITIEDDALFRHPEYKKTNDYLDPIEAEAKSKGISFVRLSGNIGLIANGAGLTLATIDQIKLAGGEAGDFLDLGGTDDPSKVAEAINLVKKSKPKVLFINIFGGVTKADTVAEGIVQAIKSSDMQFKIIVRLKGVNDEKGRKILTDNHIDAFTDISEAIKKAVEASK
jgi:succinyl-CoA synthetase beta subunit